MAILAINKSRAGARRWRLVQVAERSHELGLDDVRREKDVEFAVGKLHHRNVDVARRDFAVNDRDPQFRHEGKLIDTKGVTARYIRFYSKGSTESALNEYTEIEVYGRPAK